ncbi:MAG: alpha-galactosidase [Propionibacteriaceae bacterium]|jgi:alpha-galactosidase|nr:alpha-galactosidase [Propionibacteriaceae bacterium]
MTAQLPEQTGPTQDAQAQGPHPVSERLQHLRAGGVSLMLAIRPDAPPAILYWGEDLGNLDDAQLASITAASAPRQTSNMPEDPILLTVLPENSRSWPGTPGIEGHRDGRAFSTKFATTSWRCDPDGLGGWACVCKAEDVDAELELAVDIELTAQGLAKLRARLTNTGNSPYQLQSLTLALPVPDLADELMDFGGHHLHERAPQRHEFTQGTHVREECRGRTGLDATLLVLAGEKGFDFGTGKIWGVHTAWSGNHRMLAERLPSGERILAGGEVLQPGEITLASDESYESPWLFASFGNGMDELSARFHEYLRTTHPLRRPRPVTGNSWEAVYFDHKLEPLVSLADAFAEVGVERFVLDDGWFSHRRDDHAGLGDWEVDREVWPDGLHPLVEHVRARGMEFGLWVEPEMINPDSDLARAHPDWIMGMPWRLPPESRHQQVLNLAIPEAYDHIHSRLDALIDEYQLTYLKWDHNRDLVEAGNRVTGRATVHAQTLAVYRLIDKLKADHPGLEIESCSSGGGRADLGILERTDRMWGSDCTDAHERQQIQRYTSLLVPPEMLGSHISASENHQTWRRLSLSMRAITAIFADLGVEWDVSKLSAAEREQLAEWIALYKHWRPLLHTGKAIRIDSPDPAFWVNGVVSQDRTRALFAIVPMGTSITAPPGMWRPRGLDPERSYRVEPLEISRSTVDKTPYQPLRWWGEGLTATGKTLAEHGLRIPDLPPDEPVLVSFEEES